MTEICSRDEKRKLVIQWLRRYLLADKYRSKKRRPERYYHSYQFYYDVCLKLAIRDVIKMIEEWPNQDPIDIVASRYSWADDHVANCPPLAFTLNSMLSAYENCLSDLLIFLREEWKNEVKRRNNNEH